MKDIIQQIIRWFQEFWAGLFPQHRKKIIDAVVASLERPSQVLPGLSRVMSLGHYLQQSGPDSPLALPSSDIQTAALAIRGVTHDAAKTEDIITRIPTCIRSDEFAAALDQAVGDPLPTETEDEFVARASSSISNLLGQFLSNGRNA